MGSDLRSDRGQPSGVCRRRVTSHRRSAHRTGRSAHARVEVRSSRPAHRDAAGSVHVSHAHATRARFHCLRSSVRPLPDRVDRVLGGGALPAHRRNRAIRDHQGLSRSPHARPATAGAAHRICLRCIHRRRGGIRYTGGRRRGDARRARIHAVLRGSHLPHREHGSCRVRRDRNAAGHARRSHQSSARLAQRRCRQNLRARVVVHPRLPDDGDGRLESVARGVASGPRVRRQFRAHAIPRFEFHRAVSHGHSRFPRNDARARRAAVAVETARCRTRAAADCAAAHRDAAACVVALHPARDLRAAVGLRAIQGAARQGDVGDSVAGARRADSTATAGRSAGRAVRGEIHAEHSFGIGHIGAVRDGAVRGGAACFVRQVHRDHRRHGARSRPADSHDGRRAGAGIRDELLRQHRDARSGICGDRRIVPILQRAARMARRIPHRQRHFSERTLRESSGGHGEYAGIAARPHGGVEFQRRRHGQDDQPAEHFRRRGRHRHAGVG